MKKTSRYGFWHRNLHWVIATLVIGALALVELHDYAPRGSALRSDMMYPIAWWQSIPARLVHWVFYLLMIGQPIVGLLMVQAGNHNPGFWGLSLPQFVAPDKALSKQLGNIHVIAGNVFLWLVIIHALIALWHHWGRKDNTLRRMIYSR
jgi:cytochrome b561